MDKIKTFILTYLSDTIQILSFIFAPITVIVFTAGWIIGRLFFLPLYFITRWLAIFNGLLHQKNIAMYFGAAFGALGGVLMITGEFFVTPKRFVDVMAQRPMWAVDVVMILLYVVLFAFIFFIMSK